MNMLRLLARSWGRLLGAPALDASAFAYPVDVAALRAAIGEARRRGGAGGGR